jgi:uncharacterized protein (DUF983 family)
MMNEPSNSQTTWSRGDAAPPARPLGRAIWRGMKCRCPHCGEGRLFRRYLKVVPQCESCGEDYTAQRADDLPAYLTLFLVGHVVVGGMLEVETYYNWPLWWHVALWPLLTLVLSLGLLQPIKGGVVGLQWAVRMHGFDTTPDGDDDPALKPHPNQF